jgi:dTDP-glucose pyrophosphorylase/predicted transcriptional regulator
MTKKNILPNVITKDCSIIKALKIIEKSKLKLICFVNKENNLIGILNDGDIRRSMLKGHSLKDNIYKIINKKPIYANFDDDSEKIRKLMIRKKINFIPIIKENKLHDIVSLKYEEENDLIDVFIMAGGYGKRLYPITKKIPKPLVNINSKKKLIDLVIDNFLKFGFKKISIITFYKKNLIKKHINTKYPKKNFHFLSEKIKMGTAGGLQLINKKKVSDNFILINCDIVSEIDLDSLLRFHLKNNSDLTIVSKLRNYQLEFGSITNIKEDLVHLDEKPIINFVINAGIYVINKNCLNTLSKFKQTKSYLDMPEFINLMKKQKKKIKIFHSYEDWSDVGTHDELNKIRLSIK